MGSIDTKQLWSKAKNLNLFGDVQQGIGKYLGGGWKSPLSLAGGAYGLYDSYKRGDDLPGYAMNAGKYSLLAYSAPRAFRYAKNNFFGGEVAKAAAKSGGGGGGGGRRVVAGISDAAYTADQAAYSAANPVPRRGYTSNGKDVWDLMNPGKRNPAKPQLLLPAAPAGHSLGATVGGVPVSHIPHMEQVKGSTSLGRQHGRPNKKGIY